MSYKLASYASLIFFFFVALLYFVTAQNMPLGAGHDIGPGFLPSILSLLMMLFCFVGLFTTWRKSEDRRVELPHPYKLSFTIAVAVTFIAAWYVLERFFITSFLAIAALLFVLSPEEASWRKAARTILTSATLVGVIYLVFEYTLNLRL